MAHTKTGRGRVPRSTARARVVRPAPAASFGRPPRTLYLVALGVAAVLAVILIVISLAGGRSNGTGGSSAASPLVGATELTALLGGIPQHGTVLGSPDAPLKLAEYVDLQCPFCARWATEAFPTIVDKYVRTGKLQIEFGGLAFLGSDSVTALRTALAAADQNKLWNVVELLFRNQGAENSGWVTDSLVRRTLAAVPGLDASRVLARRGDASVTNMLNAAAAQARAGGIDSTPSFQVGRRGGGALQRLNVTSLDPNSFSSALESLLSG